MNFQTILALLIAKFSGARKDGLTQMARILALQCADEDAAKSAVENLTDAQVQEFIKEYRAGVDKEVSESNKTFEANLRKKYDLTEKQTKTEPGGNGGNEDMATLIKNAVAEAVKSFQERIDGFEASRVSESRLQMLTEKLNGCKDETFKAQTLKDFARMSFKDDAEFNEYLNDKATDIETANQAKANADLSASGGASIFSQKEESGVSKGVSDFIKSQQPEENKFAGKEV